MPLQLQRFDLTYIRLGINEYYRTEFYFCRFYQCVNAGKSQTEELLYVKFVSDSLVFTHLKKLSPFLVILILLFLTKICQLYLVTVTKKMG